MSAEYEYSKIREADGAEIISLLDNSIDFLSTLNQKDARSFRQWVKTQTHSELPKAEHGFSMLIHILSQGKTSTILFDTGCSSDGIIENSKRLGMNLTEVESIVLSHGHYDHFGGLLSVLKAAGRANLPVIVHEDMFKTRGTGNKDAFHVYPAFPTKEELSIAKLVYTKQPQLFVNDMLLVTGEIPRQTSFEKGFQQHKSLEGGDWKPDPWILDDRAIAINVKGKGLVVVSGCAHAGIINTIKYVQKITATTEVYAVLGGFHLAGKQNEERIEQTVKELKQINPKRIAPSHCTGWRGAFAIANALPEAFVCNSVGNLYTF
jgi:7,8-dihydropterin-6-yl-methyl-4-(beta-D-ribofuranosyl)aminobenzene 5'-phosphate synthase